MSRDGLRSDPPPAFEAQRIARCGCVEGVSAARVRLLRQELIEKGLWVRCWERRLLEANKDYNEDWPHVWWPRVRYPSTDTPNDMNLSQLKTILQRQCAMAESTYGLIPA